MKVDSIDDRIAIHAFNKALRHLEALKAEDEPMKYGVYMRYKAFIPKRPLSAMLEEDNPYWLGYAAIMTEFVDVFGGRSCHGK